MTSAAATGQTTLSWTFDALGRATAKTDAFGNWAYQYSLAGARTRITWPGGGFYVGYDYGAMTAVRENGATSGIGVLATYGYDNDLGRRTGTETACVTGKLGGCRAAAGCFILEGSIPNIANVIDSDSGGFDMGSVESMIWIGSAYATGTGVEKDGYVPAISYLGWMHCTGKGGERNIYEGERLLKYAIEHGNIVARALLGRKLMSSSNFLKVLRGLFVLVPALLRIAIISFREGVSGPRLY